MLSTTGRIRHYTAALFVRSPATLSRLVTGCNKLYHRSSNNADNLKSEFYTSKCLGNYQSKSTRIPLNTEVLSEVREFVETKRLNRERVTCTEVLQFVITKNICTVKKIIKVFMTNLIIEQQLDLFKDTVIHRASREEKEKSNSS